MRSPRRVISEFHFESVLFAVSVVDTKNLEQIFLVAGEIDARSTSLTVNRQWVNKPKLGNKTAAAVFLVIEVYKTGNAENIFRTEGIGFSVPNGFQNIHRFFIAFLTDFQIGVERCLDTADAVQTSFLVVVKLNPDVPVRLHKCDCDGVAAENLSTETGTCRQRS